MRSNSITKFVLIILLVILIMTCVIKCSYTQETHGKDGKKIYKNIKERRNENMKNYKKEKMYIKINDKVLIVNLENNVSSKALVEKLKENDITIDMEDYANFEKVGDLGFSLPKNDKSITTSPGDVILYMGNKLTIYYDTNSYTFTKIGKIDLSQKELKNILGDGNVRVTLSINN